MNEMEFITIDDSLYSSINNDNCTGEVNKKIYKHLKKILNENEEYYDLIDDDALEALSALGYTIDSIRCIFILLLLEADQNGEIIDRFKVYDFLLDNGVPSYNGLSFFEKITHDNVSWKKMWKRTYDKMKP